MKLVVAIVQDSKVRVFMDNLVREGFQATKLASTGGLLQKGNSTLLIGTPDKDVDRVLQILRNECAVRQVPLPMVAPMPSYPDHLDATTVDVPGTGAVAFVIPVERVFKC